ncbi:hypothetical protein FOA52_015626 [Chlamydomonas sp. UWO 241]|nr:hypothetical protein FOA52_015626 [Chlamydomonas sp. UWO 241]
MHTHTHIRHLGFLAADYGAALAGCAFVATLAGQVVMTAAVRRFGRPSLVVMIMFVLLSISAAAMYFSAFQKVASAVAHPDIAFQLSSICGVVPNATADGGDGGDDCQSAACLLLTNALA